MVFGKHYICPIGGVDYSVQSSSVFNIADITRCNTERIGNLILC